MWLPAHRLLPGILCLLFLGGSLPAADEEFGVYTDHPRLFLTARRLKLLRREKERQSMRWEQFQGLIDSAANFPEKGFAFALYSQVSQQPEFCRQAVSWSANSTDLRQLALVYDWCSADAAPLLPRIRQALSAPRPSDLEAVRGRVLAAIAISDQPREFEAELKWVVESWWRKDLVPALRAGSRTMGLTDAYALAELMHALGDTFKIDISEDFPNWFKDLPALRLLQYYPAAFPAAENAFRIPCYAEDGEPNLAAAVLARAADLSLVPADPNSRNMQFLQGWAQHDQYLMRTPLGAPYEFLWANPYQPGLSYYYAPLLLHDAWGGRLFARSSWEDDAAWFAYTNGHAQAFTGGTRKDVTLDAQPRQFGPAVILAMPPSKKFTSALPALPENAPPFVTFIFGARAHAWYQVELDFREMTEEQADAGGILELHLPPAETVNVRLRELP